MEGKDKTRQVDWKGSRSERLDRYHEIKNKKGKKMNRVLVKDICLETLQLWNINVFNSLLLRWKAWTQPLLLIFYKEVAQTMKRLFVPSYLLEPLHCRIGLPHLLLKYCIWGVCTSQSNKQPGEGNEALQLVVLQLVVGQVEYLPRLEASVTSLKGSLKEQIYTLWCFSPFWKPNLSNVLKKRLSDPCPFTLQRVTVFALFKTW